MMMMMVMMMMNKKKISWWQNVQILVNWRETTKKKLHAWLVAVKQYTCNIDELKKEWLS